MKNIGRNDPCPCGSGKKYKKCCFLEIKKAEINDLEYTRSLARRLKIKSKLVEKARDEMGISEYKILNFISDSSIFKNRDLDTLYNMDEHFVFFNILISECSIFAYPIKNENMFLWEYYLTNFPASLNESERIFLESIKRFTAGFFQIREIDRKGFITTVEDIFTQKTYRVLDKKLCEIALKHDVFGGILIPYNDNGIYISDGATPSAFSPGDKEYIRSTIQLLYKKENRNFRKVGNEELSRFINKFPISLYRVSLDHFLFMNDDRDFPQHRILTKDKKQFILIKAYYKISDREDIKRKILNIRGFRIINESVESIELSWVNHKGILFGEVYIGNNEMIFLTSAREHFEKWKGLVRDIPLEFSHMEEIDQQEIMGSLIQGIEDDLFTEKPDNISAEEFRRSALQEWKDFYNIWPKLKQPDLNNQSPAEAIRTAVGRQRVADLIDCYENEMNSFNNYQYGENKAKYFNVDELRKRLNI